MNDLPLLDPRALQDLLDLGAEPSLVQELITLLEEDAPVRLTLLGQALAAENRAGIAGEAHQLKGALGNLGLQRAAAAAAHLEADAAEGALDTLSDQVRALPDLLEASRQALRQAFPV